MPKNPPKEKGNSGQCFKCNANIYCREKEYQGTISLQWQDKEGKAHYDKGGGCKVQGSVSTPVAQIIESKVVWTKLDEKTDDQTQLQEGEGMFNSLAYETAVSRHPDMSQNSNTFGQIVNAIETHLIQLALVKATKEIN